MTTAALELEQLCKAYQVVKKVSQPTQIPARQWQAVTRFLLGETFSLMGQRQVTAIPALDRVSFTVEPGQVVGLFGKNGSGKTTLLSILGRVFSPDRGTARCFGHDLATDLYAVCKYIVPIFGWLDAIT